MIKHFGKARGEERNIEIYWRLLCYSDTFFFGLKKRKKNMNKRQTTMQICGKESRINGEGRKEKEFNEKCGWKIGGNAASCKNSIAEAIVKKHFDSIII